ncbi:MAG: hypothetical protein PHS74_00170 [Lachnospiraceae bacterium]|nr:hypothetical protein [Lachnospiraceae bacterium]
MSVNKVIYGGKTLIDLTSDTVTANTLQKGYTAHTKSGAIVTGTCSDEINRIMTAGLTDGYTEYSDDGTIISTTDSEGRTLTKTFTDGFLTCTTVLKNQNGVILGKTIKKFTNNCSVVTTTDLEGKKLTKTFSADLKTCEAKLTNSAGTELAKMNKVFSDDGQSVTSVFTYS